MRYLLGIVALALVAASPVSAGKIFKGQGSSDAVLDCSAVKASSCIIPIFSSFQEDLSSSANRTALERNRTRLGDFATAAQFLETCAEAYYNQYQVCANDSFDDAGLALIYFYADYLSSSDRVDLANAAAISVCADDEDKRNLFEKESLKCVFDRLMNLTDLSDVCGGINALRACLVSAGTKVCDEDVGALFEDLSAYTSQLNVDASPLFDSIADKNVASLLLSCNKQVPVKPAASRKSRAINFLQQFFE